MAVYLNLFSPITYEAFSQSDRTVSGFQTTQQGRAEKIRPGDILICYMTRLSRWIGLLEVESESYIDDTPVFYPENDPFVVRFKVKPLVWLELNHTIPIHEPEVFGTLSFTKDHDPTKSRWTGPLKGSLAGVKAQDARYLIELLNQQMVTKKQYPVDEHTYLKHIGHLVKTDRGMVSVTVPDDDTNGEGVSSVVERESIVVQAKVATIGLKMGFKVWVPKNDRIAVLNSIPIENPPILSNLPLNYDDTTLSTIERIDVLWIAGRRIVRAFEIEHTTAVYSGILRMADLRALQPNMDIRCYIVAPEERQDKVFRELRRPVFSLLDGGPLAEYCLYLSYDSVDAISNEPNLQYLKPEVIDAYAESAD